MSGWPLKSLTRFGQPFGQRDRAQVSRPRQVRPARNGVAEVFGGTDRVVVNHARLATRAAHVPLVSIGCSELQTDLATRRP